MEGGVGAAAPSGIDDPAFAEIAEACARGDLVLFAGAGVSEAAGLPPWKRLVELLEERARARSVEEPVITEIGEFVSKEKRIDALSAAKAALGGSEFCTTLERHLDDRRFGIPEVALAIAALAPRLRALCTTNIDRLLERALLGDWPEMARATGDIAQRRGVIFKLHGTLYDRSTWVITRDERDRAMYADPRQKSAFEAIFQAHTLLFVGYGLDDDDLDEVLARTRALAGDQPPRHFALVPAETVTPYRRKKIEDAGVRLVTYEN